MSRLGISLLQVSRRLNIYLISRLSQSAGKPSGSTRSARSFSFSQFRTAGRCTTQRSFSSDKRRSLKAITSDKQLVKYMDTFQTKTAVSFLHESMENNTTPSGGTIVNFIQQLGNLGEVEALLGLRDKLLDAKICSPDSFYPQLINAFGNTGRIEEGIDLIKEMYINNDRNFKEMETFFIGLTLSIIRDFQGCLPKILEFVENCKLSNDTDATVCLWKCFLYCEKFEEAEKLIDSQNIIKNQENKAYLDVKALSDIESGEYRMDVQSSGEVNLVPKLRTAVNDIVMSKDKVVTDKISVLKYLSEQVFLRRKLQAQLFATLLMLLSADGRDQEIETLIEKASALGLEEKIMELTDSQCP